MRFSEANGCCNIDSCVLSCMQTELIVQMARTCVKQWQATWMPLTNLPCVTVFDSQPRVRPRAKRWARLWSAKCAGTPAVGNTTASTPATAAAASSNAAWGGGSFTGKRRHNYWSYLSTILSCLYFLLLQFRGKYTFYPTLLIWQH